MSDAITPTTENLPSNETEKPASSAPDMRQAIYSEVGTNYRYFLTWRQATVAAAAFGLFGIVKLTVDLQMAENKFPYAWLIPFGGIPLGLILWIIDSRNRDMYHAAIYAGDQLEGEIPGFYSTLKKKGMVDNDLRTFKSSASHTRAIFWFLLIYYGLVLAVLSYLLGGGEFLSSVISAWSYPPSP